MPEPKKQNTKRGTGLRRSHIRLNLAKKVNGKSPVKVFTTSKQSGKALSAKVAGKKPRVSKKAKAPVKKAKNPASKAKK